MTLGVPEEKREFIEEIPEEIRNALDGRIGETEQIRVSISTDITLDGEYGTGWLLATDERLISVSPNGAGAPRMIHLPMEDVDSVQMQDLFGSNTLKVRTADRGIEVARFSKSLVPKFARVPAEIETLIRKKKPLEMGAEDQTAYQDMRPNRKRIRCPKCGRAIPEWTDICPRCIKKGRLLFRLLGYAAPYWKLFTVGLSIMLVATIIALMPPLLMRMLIDDVLVLKPLAQDVSGLRLFLLGLGERGTPTLLALLVALSLAISISSNGLQAIRGYLMARFGQRITLDLRNKLYRHLHTLSLGFYAQRETGRIMSRVTQDVSRVQDFISDGLQEGIRSILTLVLIAAILFRLNPGLAVLVLLPTPFLVVITLLFSNKLHRVFHALWKRWAGLSAILADTLPGMRVVKAFTQEEREIKKFDEKSTQLFHMEIKATKLRTMFGPMMDFITYLGTVIIWWVGGRNVMEGHLTLGDFTAFTGYMWQFYMPVQTLCRLNHRFQHAATSAERVFEVLDAEPDIADAPQAVELPEVVGRIQFRDVTFAYEEGKPVLKHIDFDVAPGEMIGLAGHSGAGKSTLINLLCRFYDVNEGGILVDGKDVRDVTMKSLRSQIGVVLQDPFLFNGTVTENIAYGQPGATMRQVVAAARAANAHDFIMGFPDAYDTQVGERGTKVSAGERQRLAIARAILKDPRILILDEATSSVDTETESKIQEALERLVKGRTTFAIAHRLSTLRNADRLFVIEKGTLAEMGTHEALLEQDGIYARLCRMQTKLSSIRAW
ncbi:MAG: ABC transporter ATP-binding protein [Candidatus Latescibacterota bacterium]